MVLSRKLKKVTKHKKNTKKYANRKTKSNINKMQKGGVIHFPKIFGKETKQKIESIDRMVAEENEKRKVEEKKI